MNAIKISLPVLTLLFTLLTISGAKSQTLVPTMREEADEPNKEVFTLPNEDLVDYSLMFPTVVFDRDFIPSGIARELNVDGLNSSSNNNEVVTLAAEIPEGSNLLGILALGLGCLFIGKPKITRKNKK